MAPANCVSNPLLPFFSPAFAREAQRAALTGSKVEAGIPTRQEFARADRNPALPSCDRIVMLLLRSLSGCVWWRLRHLCNLSVFSVADATQPTPFSACWGQCSHLKRIKLKIRTHTHKTSRLLTWSRRCQRSCAHLLDCDVVGVIDFFPDFGG